MFVGLLTRAMLWCTDRTTPEFFSCAIYHGPMAFAAICALLSLACTLFGVGAVLALVLTLNVANVQPSAWLALFAPGALLAVCVATEVLLVWVLRKPLNSMRSMRLRRGEVEMEQIEMTEQQMV